MATPISSPRVTFAALLLATALAFIAGRAPADSILAAPWLSFDVGIRPTAILMADVNGDGLPDAIAANQSSATVSCLLGNGDGTFGLKTDFATARTPVSLATGDLNGDGRLDIAVADSGSNVISVLLGNGNGTFGPQSVFPTGNTPVAVALGDFNGDGRLDLVAANDLANTVSILIGRGDGSFQPRTDLQAGPNPWSVAATDLNRDGRTDLVAANNTNSTVSVWLGNGDGSFSSRTDFITGDGPIFVATRDVNRDGRLDLVVGDYGLPSTNYSTNAVSVLLGNGDGTFAGKMDFAVGSRPTSIDFTDFDQDGHLDLITANSGDHAVTMLLGNGDGSFGSRRDFMTGPNPWSVAATDVNRDGRPDVVAANLGCNTMSVLLNNGTGGFGPRVTSATGGTVQSVAVGDLNRDSKWDVVTANSSNTVSVLVGNGDGTFASHVDYSSLGFSPSSLVIADFNGDSRQDVIVANKGYPFSGRVAVLPGDGNGGLAPGGSYGIGLAVTCVALADVDRNGQLDMVLAEPFDDYITILLFLPGGVFTRRIDLSAGCAYTVVPQDLNGDGRPDLVITAGCSQAIAVMLANGAATFTPEVAYPIGQPSPALAIADVNNDGRLDVVGANINPAAAVLLGNGDGSLQPVRLSPTGGGAAVAVADIDGDGREDLVTANRESNSISLLLGKGDGTFWPKIDLGTGGDGPSCVAVQDVNADGRPDVIVGNGLSANVSILLNTGAGSPTPTLLSRFEAKWVDQAVDVSWQFASDAAISEAVVERSESVDGPWFQVAGEPRRDQGGWVLRDANVQPSVIYLYRLQAAFADGKTQMVFGPIQATGAPPATFALLPIGPNPSQGNASIAYLVPRAAWVRLSVLDVQGRRAALLGQGQVAAGRHTIRSGAARALENLGPGLYWVRLEWRGGAAIQRLAIVR